MTQALAIIAILALGALAHRIGREHGRRVARWIDQQPDQVDRFRDADGTNDDD